MRDVNADGMKNQEIALQLNLTEHTVRNYLIRIFDKLGISSRVELVIYAFSGTEGDVTAEDDTLAVTWTVNYKVTTLD
jgi:predicted transcriptional regulator